MDDLPKNSPSHWSASRVVIATLFVVAVGLGFWLLFRYRMVILILFTAIILGTALGPVVEAFSRRGLPRAYGLLAVYLVLAGGVAGIVFITARIIATQSLALASSLPEIYQNFRIGLMKSPNSFLLRNLGMYLPIEPRLLFNASRIESGTLDAAALFFNISGSFVKGLLAAVAIFLLTSFWVLESERSVRSLLLYTPQRLRQPAQEIYEAIEQRVGAFVRGQLILCFSIGGVALISYLIIGVPNAVVLAIIAGIFEAVPILGPALGAIPALLIAYSVSPTMALWVLLSTVIMQGLENYLLVPRVMGAAVGVNPILTMLVLATSTSLLGLPGALLAIPFAAILQLVMNRFLIAREDTLWSAETGRGRQSALRYDVQELIEDIRKQLREKEERSNEASDQVEDSLEALAVELDLFLKNDLPEQTT